MSEPHSAGRTFALFTLVAVASAAAALPLFGYVPAPWSEAPTAKPDAEKPKPGELAKAEKARLPSAVAAPAPRKKRIVWAGGGDSGPSEGAAPRPAANKPAAPAAVKPAPTTVRRG
jgi:DnaK suppressor protein